MDMLSAPNEVQTKKKLKHRAYIYIDVPNVVVMGNTVSIERTLAWFNWSDLLKRIKRELPVDCKIVFARAYIPHYGRFGWNIDQAERALKRQLPKIFSTRIEEKRDVDSVIVSDIWQNGVDALMQAKKSDHIHIVVVSGDHCFKQTLDAMTFQFKSKEHVSAAHLHKYVWAWEGSMSNIWKDGSTHVQYLNLVLPKKH